MTDWVRHTTTPDETRLLGRALGESARPGLVVGLVGPLGAGKTLFVRGVAEGIGVPDSRIVNSPTFVLVQEYHGRLPVYHFDTYRLDDPRQFELLGPEEYFEGDGVCLVEWADRVPNVMPIERLDVHLEVTGPSTRTVRFTAQGRLAADVLAACFERRVT